MDPLRLLAGYEDSDEESDNGDLAVDNNARIRRHSYRSRDDDDKIAESLTVVVKVPAIDSTVAGTVKNRRSTELPEAPESNRNTDDSDQFSFSDDDIDIRKTPTDLENRRLHTSEPVAPRGGGAANKLLLGMSPSPSSSTAASTPTAMKTKATKGIAAVDTVAALSSLASYKDDDQQEQGLSFVAASTDDNLDSSLKRKRREDQRVEQQDRMETSEQLPDIEFDDSRVTLSSVVEVTTLSKAIDSPSSIDRPSDASTSIELPPEPSESCDQLLEERFARYFQRMERGYDFNAEIQKRKDFRNPSIYEKLISLFGVDEYGSNFRKSLWDPHGFGPNDYYEKISDAQKIRMDQIQGKAPKIDPKQRNAAAASADQIAAGNKQRRSKWDAPKSDAVAVGAPPGKKARL